MADGNLTGHDVAAGGWFPTGTSDTPGWRLDIVSLLAVIGESSMAEHAQAMTASWLCVLPRIIPAPQVLLKPTRPTRLPQVNAHVVGVDNGTLLTTLNYFPNIMLPIESLAAFDFRVYRISHSKERVDSIQKSRPRAVNTDKTQQNGTQRQELPYHVTGGRSTATSPSPALKKRGTMNSVLEYGQKMVKKDTLPPHVPCRTYSPLNILSILSCALTVGVFILSVYNKDGIACLALGTISLASSIVGYASMWSPQLMNRRSLTTVPDGDVVIRTREGAFIVVKCDENVARELYTGTEECKYTVESASWYRGLVGLGTFLLMVSVVLLGNCNFPQQLAIGASYIVLNGLFWGAALMPKSFLWDMSLYEIKPDKCNDDPAVRGDPNAPDIEDRPSYTRTMWFAIRETKKVGWVLKSGAAPKTEEWDAWLKEAETAAREENRGWKAVKRKDELVSVTTTAMVNDIEVPGAQDAPQDVVLPNPRR